jgi:hypothetical protein
MEMGIRVSRHECRAQRLPRRDGTPRSERVAQGALRRGVMNWLRPDSAPSSVGVCTGHALPLSPVWSPPRSIPLPHSRIHGVYDCSDTSQTLPWNAYNLCNATHTNVAHYELPPNATATGGGQPLPPPALAHDPPAHTRRPRSLRTRSRSTLGLVPRRRGLARVRSRRRSDCARRHNALRSLIRAHDAG